ncbi:MULTISPECIES: hypothetical protein [unclassified Undibacterium]|uniref:hypothetical protein n=1 Tax=unclassified Undibacterium TaxID=2630295 RepID=UPI002AC8C266|nr:MULTISPECIES: hypothetical protein [unclassified Undibacterium]MEB0138124.1 hypothetical protein [Undibacterium sp. CCC2.1]MEB0171121.1 hypothetical protein [Undibacterium sp. CCC1.1]MEB0175166.1 hypothetical protein [Undibacterium sp. CCC3.4]MEB0214250.1 hypothetical protein [Undibacterium sp. 5I2]WPX41830.1 hypothetical protein RHM61_10410 [Undibacterium sp. CCC3.4]
MQELNIEQIESVVGGTIGGQLFPGYIFGEAMNMAVGGFVSWCNSGAGIGGRMDTMGKLG